MRDSQVFSPPTKREPHEVLRVSSNLASAFQLLPFCIVKYDHRFPSALDYCMVSFWQCALSPAQPASPLIPTESANCPSRLFSASSSDCTHLKVVAFSQWESTMLSKCLLTLAKLSVLSVPPFVCKWGKYWTVFDRIPGLHKIYVSSRGWLADSVGFCLLCAPSAVTVCGHLE